MTSQFKNILLLIAFVGFVIFTSNPSNSLNDNSLLDNPNYWKEYNGEKLLNTVFWSEKIEQVGGIGAYEFLKKQVEPLDDYGRHLTAHQFGDALYAVEGLNGVRTCDHSFGQGCFHQFFMSAFRDKGESVIPAFSQACMDKLGDTETVRGCNHGMGHGVMIAFEGRKAEQALEACATLKHQNSFYGCIDGVFMEYFTPTHLGRNGEAPPKREFNPENPLGLCGKIDSKFQPTCYYMQASWWLYIAKTPAETAELCRKTSDNSATCFKAIGHTIVLSTAYKKTRTLEICKEISLNTDEEVACRTGAHWAFSHAEEVGEKITEEEKQLCNFSEPALKTKCLADSDMAGKPIGISVICCNRKL